MRRITNYLTGAFLLFLLLSCTNDGNDRTEKKDSLNKLKEELHLEKFSNANIAGNVEVDWNNGLQTENKDAAILEFDAKEKFPSKLQSSFLKTEMNYQLISIESEGELKNYFIEIFSYNDSDTYSKTITKLNKFTGVFNVFSLNGQNLGSIAIDHGNARNISESKALDFLAETINSLYVSSGITQKIPLCDGTYTQVVEQSQDRYRIVSLNGKVLSVEYMDTVVKRTTTILPYPCDGSGDKDAIILQRTAHYYTGDGKSYAGVSGLLDAIITDPSFSNNPCLVAVFTKLGGSPTFQTYLKRFDSDFSVADLKLSVGIDAAHPTASAVTYQPINSVIEIKFNPDRLNTPPLNIAKNFAHEILHAEMFEKLLKLSKKKEIPWSAEFIESIRNDEPQIAEYYTRYWYDIPIGGAISDPQHEYMAQLSINTIKDILKQYDNTQSEDVYTAIAWSGLMGKGEPNKMTGLPPQPTAAWVNVPQEERVRLNNIYNNFKDTNSPCQQ